MGLLVIQTSHNWVPPLPLPCHHKQNYSGRYLSPLSNLPLSEFLPILPVFHKKGAGAQPQKFSCWSSDSWRHKMGHWDSIPTIHIQFVKVNIISTPLFRKSYPLGFSAIFPAATRLDCMLYKIPGSLIPCFQIESELAFLAHIPQLLGIIARHPRNGQKWQELLPSCLPNWWFLWIHTSWLCSLLLWL